MEKEVIHREKNKFYFPFSLFPYLQAANQRTKLKWNVKKEAVFLFPIKTTCIIRKIQIQDSQESVILLNKKHEVSNKQVGAINREKVAEMITSMTVKLPDVTNAATLVTDDEVFVVYRANTTDPKLVADQVYRAALSIVPRYYKAYVSTDQKVDFSNSRASIWRIK